MPVAAPAAPRVLPNVDQERRALVIGDSEPARDASGILTDEGWQVTRRASAEEADETPLRATVLVLDGAGGTDGTLDGADLRSRLSPETAILVLADRETAGADLGGLGPARPRLVRTPVRRDLFLTALEAELGVRNLLRENRILRQELRTATRLEAWVGCSSRAAEVRSAITTTAFAEGPVLVVGEAGTGRRLAAELVHRVGRQSSLPFLALTAAGLPAGELGAILARLGRGEASGVRPGSLYLSGIERLSARDQAVLDDAVARPPAFRLMLSGPPDLPQRVRAGKFSRPLLGRLLTSTIRIPTLRERREDIPALLLHFLGEARLSPDESLFGIAESTVDACSGYDWPGNTAELRAWVERAVATARVSRFDGTVLPEAVCPPPDGVAPRPAQTGSRPLRTVLAEIEKTLIERALARTRGNQKRAAQQLQVNPTTLHEKMKRHGLLRRPRPAGLPTRTSEEAGVA